MNPEKLRLVRELLDEFTGYREQHYIGPSAQSALWDMYTECKQRFFDASGDGVLLREVCPRCGQEPLPVIAAKLMELAEELRRLP